MVAPWPHMSPGDAPLFASFVLSDQGRLYTAWGFDLHLGPGQGTPDLVLNPTAFDIGRFLTQLRVDAVGWIGDSPTIIEVKPEARLTALGQLLAYCYEWRERFGQDCNRAVVTDFANDQTLRIFNAFNITTYQVLPATPAQIAQAVAWTNTLPRRDS